MDRESESVVGAQKKMRGYFYFFLAACLTVSDMPWYSLVQH